MTSPKSSAKLRGTLDKEREGLGILNSIEMLQFRFISLIIILIRIMVTMKCIEHFSIKFTAFSNKHYRN
jgi:hypothetical protein